MRAPSSSWPTGLRLVLAFILAATLIGTLQAVALLLGRLPASAHNVVYVTVSMLAYFAAVAAGVMGRRRAFFWNALAIASLHAVFTGWYLLSTVRLLIDLQVSPFPLSGFELWNLSVFALALALAAYLLALERRRLFGPTAET